MKTMSKGYFESESVCTWKLSTYHAYDKNNAEYVNVKPFHNKSDVIVGSENVWTNDNVPKCTRSCNKTTQFSLKKKLQRKGKLQYFWSHSVIFFAKFDLYNTAFQNLFT